MVGDIRKKREKAYKVETSTQLATKKKLNLNVGDVSPPLEACNTLLTLEIRHPSTAELLADTAFYRLVPRT